MLIDSANLSDVIVALMIAALVALLFCPCTAYAQFPGDDAEALSLPQLEQRISSPGVKSSASHLGVCQL